MNILCCCSSALHGGKLLASTPLCIGLFTVALGPNAFSIAVEQNPFSELLSAAFAPNRVASKSQLVQRPHYGSINPRLKWKHKSSEVIVPALEHGMIHSGSGRVMTKIAISHGP